MSILSSLCHLIKKPSIPTSFYITQIRFIFLFPPKISDLLPSSPLSVSNFRAIFISSSYCSTEQKPSALCLNGHTKGEKQRISTHRECSYASS
ncbi:hypothetical protein L2E82_50244 [Cichorium intybus]|nr:hypothetical protein L2E82_50244 [Cichorium intybus]